MVLDDSLLARLKTQHRAVPAMIAGLSDAQILSKPAPGKWSIKDNISHLARYQLVFLQRLNQILNTRAPVFEPYKAENDAEFPAWQQKGLPDLLVSLQVERGRLSNLLVALMPADLSKTGYHAKYGRLDIPGWIQFFLLHEAHHLFTIFQLAHATNV